MRHTIFAFLGLCLITASTSAQSRPQVQPIDPQPFGAPVVERLQLDILPAFTHKNLTVLLLQGEERIPGAKYLTLSEALQQRKVIVHETQTVHSLTVENISGRDLVIIQAGDIVKGGKQDRVIPYDVIVPPGSGKMPLPSFCVEAHRWKKRGDESDKQVSSSTDVLHSNALKLAARYHRSQREVWNRARSTQRQLSRTLNHDVTATRSVSSLQLTLEHRTAASGVNESAARFAEALSGRDRCRVCDQWQSAVRRDLCIACAVEESLEEARQGRGGRSDCPTGEAPSMGAGDRGTDSRIPRRCR